MADSFGASRRLACCLCMKRAPRSASSWGLSTSHRLVLQVAVVCSMCKNSVSRKMVEPPLADSKVTRTVAAS